MRFYTMQRGGEVFTMRWADVDLVDGWWEIPGEYTKNGQLHRVPLSTAAVGQLARRLQTARPNAVWVFENVQPSKNPNRQFGNVRYRGKKAAAVLSRAMHT
jgi:integrase